MAEIKHTALYVETCPGKTYLIQDGFGIAKMLGPKREREERAAFIVTACNAHDDLVRALKAIEFADSPHFHCPECQGQPSTGHTAYCRVRAALAKVTTADTAQPEETKQ